MSKWSKGIRKMLSAAGISFLIAANAMVMPLCASAATAVTDGVMIRNDASTEAGIIGSLNEGDEVTILDVIQSGDGYAWYYIELDNGNKGYVRSDLLSASEEELKEFGGAPVNEEKEEPEEEKEEKEEKAEEKKEAEAAKKKDEKKEESKAEEAPAEAATGQETPAASEDYDASKDPNAHFSVKFETEADGSGNWYVYNDDNGSRIKISDMKESAEKADSSKSAGLWKPAAIIFGLLTLALAAFVLFLIKSIREGRSKSSRRRSLEVAGYAPYEEEEGGEEENSEDEYYFTDDEDGEDGEEIADSTIEAEIPEEEEPVDLPSDDETDAEIGAVTDGLRKAVQDLTEADDTTGEVSVQKEVPEAETAAEDESAPEDADDEAAEEVQMPPADENEEDSVSDPVEEEEVSETDTDEDYISEEELSEEDFEDEGFDEEYSDEEDYDEEDYDEEDYDEEDFDEEDYEEDEEEYTDDEDSGVRSRRKNNGGFFGFIKKVFGSDSSEDSEDEGEDFDVEEENEHEFDEFSEYPEDIDLLPREESADDDFAEEERFDEDSAADTGSGNARGRLSMQRVMKNVGYREEENDFSDSDLAEDDDLAESLFDDDDDMSFSFIGSSRKK